MKPRCRLCDRKAVDDSIFCAQHREQAQRFSLSFGKQDEDETAAESPPTGRETTAKTDANEKTEKSEKAEKPRPVEPEGAPADTAPAHAELDEERAVLAAAFHPAFDALRTRLKEEADLERWPQLSIYFLEDTLYCRAYFSVIPRSADGEPPPPVYALHDERLHAALAAGGIVFEELYARYSVKVEALRDLSLQTLDVHFLTYAGLIAINGHPPGRAHENLVTFDLDGDDFRAIELDDDVRARMRHDHW